MADTMRKPDPRYAVFFAPRPGSDHGLLGARWLGRDARSGASLPQPRVPGLSPARQAQLTAMARHYGLHATLKPPFRLRENAQLPQLEAMLRALASAQSPFSFQLALRPLDGFLAWQPVDQQARLNALAAVCVTELDAYRQAADAAELARRRQAGLSARQDALLLRWGYPYVLDEFRFHLTLSDRLQEPEASQMRSALEAECQPLRDTALMFDALALFVQATPDSPFLHVRSYGFDGSLWSAESGAP